MSSRTFKKSVIFIGWDPLIEISTTEEVVVVVPSPRLYLNSEVSP
jgi:hypothetical protein